MRAPNAFMKRNIFQGVNPYFPEELLETLLQTPHVRIERIVSRGHKSDDDFWYDQVRSEWVLVVKGRARLEFEDEVIELGAGDCIHIEAHKKHRVQWTPPDEDTVWLAVFH